MTGVPDDRDLRDRFHALAAEDGARVPAFAVQAARPRPRHPVVRWAVGAAAVLAVAAGYRWLAVERTPLPYPIDLGAVSWEGPTDFLLATPGAALLTDLPRIGTGADAVPATPPLTDDTLGRNRS